MIISDCIRVAANSVSTHRLFRTSAHFLDWVIWFFIVEIFLIRHSHLAVLATSLPSQFDFEVSSVCTGPDVR